MNAGRGGPPLQNATAVADAVLFEGYMLYPYRANDAKNRVRWQFGVLCPPAFAAADPSERDHLETACLIDGPATTLSVRVRFLQTQRRTVERATGGGFTAVESLDVGDASFVAWDEAVVQEITTHVALPASTAVVTERDLRVTGGVDVEMLGAPHDPLGRLVRERDPLDARLIVEVAPLPGPYGVREVRLRVQNRTEWTASGAPTRSAALRHSLIATHLLIWVDHGAFISLIDPPQWARGYAEQCDQVGVFPVLAGPPGEHRVVLAAPIILYDHPAVAPESTAQFCDATEMDEMLTLRTMTLTNEEKRQARGSDPRAAALVDDVDNLPPELIERLHGAIRSMTATARAATSTDAEPDPDPDVVMIGASRVGRGSRVRLRPGSRRADAQDMFLHGRTGTVEEVLFDLDDGSHLAVTLDDIAEDGVNQHGRFLYFSPDEVEPLEPLVTERQ